MHPIPALKGEAGQGQFRALPQGQDPGRSPDQEVVLDPEGVDQDLGQALDLGQGRGPDRVPVPVLVPLAQDLAPQDPPVQDQDLQGHAQDPHAPGLDRLGHVLDPRDLDLDQVEGPVRSRILKKRRKRKGRRRQRRKNR